MGIRESACGQLRVDIPWHHSTLTEAVLFDEFGSDGAYTQRRLHDHSDGAWGVLYGFASREYQENYGHILTRASIC